MLPDPVGEVPGDEDAGTIILIGTTCGFAAKAVLPSSLTVERTPRSPARESLPSADLVRPGTAPPRMADQVRVSRFCVRGYTIVIAAWSRQ